MAKQFSCEGSTAYYKGTDGAKYRVKKVTPDIVTVRTIPRIGHAYDTTLVGPAAHVVLRSVGLVA